MKTTRRFDRCVAGLMCLALVTPRLVRAETAPSVASTPRAFQTLDIRLSPEGEFRGQLVDSHGQPGRVVPVELWQEGHVVARQMTDGQGCFQFGRVQAGVYQVLTPGTGTIVRLWQPAAAPPAAQDTMMLVRGAVVRGQHPPHHAPHGGVYDGVFMKTLSNPWVFTGLLGAGIAVPIALSNNDDDDREGS
jgi:hypothetical protein